MSFAGNCRQIQNKCPSCPFTAQLGVTINKPMFGMSYPSNNSQRTAINGLMNFRPSKTSASQSLDIKKTLTLVHMTAKDSRTGDPNTSFTNVGGPGDDIASVFTIGKMASGNKARLIMRPKDTGVDVKHNSYERYISRKKGNVMLAMCQNC